MGPLQNIKHTIHAPHLHGWAGLHAQWNVEFDSYALQTPAGVVLVDPIQPPQAVVKQLEKLGQPIAIVLTNANHERDAHWFRQRYDIPVYAHENTPDDCDIKIDVLVADHEQLPGGITAIHLPGAAVGEIALHTNLDGGAMLIGDILIHPHGQAVTLPPDQYLTDPKLARQSLRRLLDWNFTTATFAHGVPLTGDAKKRITAFLKQPKGKNP
jgi:hypothetical protein